MKFKSNHSSYMTWIRMSPNPIIDGFPGNWYNWIPTLSLPAVVVNRKNTAFWRNLCKLSEIYRNISEWLWNIRIIPGGWMEASCRRENERNSHLISSKIIPFLLKVCKRRKTGVVWAFLWAEHGSIVFFLLANT